MHKKPRILVVSYNFPRPDMSSGELRFVSILEILCGFWDLDFCVADSHVEWNSSEEMIPYIKKLEDMGIRVLKPSKESFSNAVRDNHYAGGYFNLYWIAEEMMPRFKIAQPDAFTIVDSVDVHFAREETQAKLGAVEMTQVLQTKKRELGVYRSADVTIAVSKDDLQLLSLKEGVKNIFLIPNMVREYPRIEGKRDPIVIFIGSYAWYPNPEAVIWFTTAIWPTIHALKPKAEFLIIGSDPTPAVLALADIPGVKVLGYVPETRPYLEKAAVSVAPLLVGGGMKGKVNEAMAHGIPVVSTSIGAQGFDFIHGKNMMVTDDPDEFAKCVISLLEDEKLQRQVGLAGKHLNAAICSHTAVKKNIREMADHCNRLIPPQNISPLRKQSQSLSGKLSLVGHDMGYALRLLKREGVKSFLSRTLLYLQGHRFPPLPDSIKQERVIKTDFVKPEGFLEFPMVKEPPMVSIIIPAYNQWEFTYSCLDSILKNSDGVSYEIILADDNSSDDTQFVNQFVKNIRVVRNIKNLGFLLNCNNAATLAKGKYIVFLNNDTLVQQDWLKWFVKTMEEHPDVGMAGAKLVFSTGELQEAGGIIFKDGSATNYGRFDWPGLSKYNYFKDVDYCSGACICLRTELWTKAGGFDPLFSPGYYDDTDLAMQVRAMGYRVVYQPKTMIIHFEGISHGVDLTEGIKSNQPQNQRLFYEKWKHELERNHYARNENTFKARDKGRGRHTILLIDYHVPGTSGHIDKQKYLMIIHSLIATGSKVIIMPEDFLKTEPDVDDLEQKGIEVLYGRWYNENWWLWINENAVNINTIVFIDEHISKKYTTVLKSIPKADFNMTVVNQKGVLDLDIVKQR